MSSEVTRESIRQAKRRQLREAFGRIRRGAPEGWTEFLLGLEAKAIAVLNAWDRDADIQLADRERTARRNRMPRSLRKATSAVQLVLALDHYVTDVLVE